MITFQASDGTKFAASADGVVSISNEQIFS